MKYPRSAVWIVSLCLLPAAGCGVSSSGLGTRADAADGPNKTLDTRATTDLDIHPLLPETNSDAFPVAALDGAPDAAPANTLDATLDRASSPDGATTSSDLFLVDSAPVVDAPSTIEVETILDAPWTNDTNDTDNANDAADGPLAAQPDGPVIVQVDGQVDGPALDTLLLDSAPPDLPPPDLAPADRVPDLPPIVDVPGPDLSPPDLGPQPTTNWVIDNTTSIGGFAPTVMGAPTVTAMDAGTAVCFDGTQDGLVLATNPIQGMQAFTIEALVFPEFTGVSDVRLIHVGDANANNPRVVMEMRSDVSGNWHALAVFNWNRTNTTIEDTNNIHPSGQWYWLTITYDGQIARVYVNGVLENSRNLTFGSVAAASVSLGARPTGPFYYPGCMRDVKFFGSALPASQLDRP